MACPQIPLPSQTNGITITPPIVPPREGDERMLDLIKEHGQKSRRSAHEIRQARNLASGFSDTIHVYQ